MLFIVKQTIKQKSLSFWKLIFIICLSVMAIHLVVEMFGNFSPFMGMIGGLIALLSAVIICFLIIYKHMAYFNYKLIGDELIMEKVFGKANHLFLVLRLHEMKQFKPYKDVDIQQLKKNNVRIYWFITGKDVKNWYVGTFQRDGRQYGFIIQPNEELLNAIKAFRTA